MIQNLLAAGSWTSDFIGLFQDVNIICMVCLAIGLILCTIECFIPGFGVFGITGIVFCTFSIVFMLVMGGTWRQFLYMLGIIAIVITIVLLVAVRSARFGALSKSALIQNATALPEDYSSNEKNYSYLMGKIGTADTVCKPSGKALIEGQLYSVITDGEYIEKGKEIYVSEVDGATIYVKAR